MKKFQPQRQVQAMGAYSNPLVSDAFSMRLVQQIPFLIQNNFIQIQIEEKAFGIIL